MLKPSHFSTLNLVQCLELADTEDGSNVDRAETVESLNTVT